MITAFGLLLVSGALVLVAPGLLRRVTNTGRWPLLSLLAWQLISWCVLAGLLLAGVFFARPSIDGYVHVPISLHSCFEVIGGVTKSAHADWLQITAALAVVGILLRLSGCAAATVTATHRRRARHRLLLGLVARRDAALNLHIVTGDVPVAYCIPGHGGCVVFTSAAMNRLTAGQRTAVLAHERAHLHGKHHLMLASAGLLERAFPRMALFRQARDQTALLVEMRADDVAARCHGPRMVAEALLSLADVVGPAGALSATGTSTATRIERLIVPTTRRLRSALGASGLVIGVAILALSPLLLAVAGHAVICRL